MAKARYVIDNMPLRGGLITAGQHGTIPENALWRADNCISGIDGVITKRPGLWQWGQVIKYPAASTPVWFYEPFNSTDGWAQAGASEVIASTLLNKLVVNITPAGTPGTRVLGRQVTGAQADGPTADWSLRFTARASNMPEEGQIIVSARARSGDDPYALRITGTEVQYYATGGIWTTMYELPFQDLAATTFEIRRAGASMELYVNEGLVATQAGGMDPYVAMTQGEYLELHFYAEDTLPQHTFYVTDLMFEGEVDEPFIAQRIGAGTDFRTIVGGSAVQRFLVVSGENYLYRDAGLRKEWSPLMPLAGGNVTFAQFGKEMIIFDAGSGFTSRAYRWNGVDAPKLLDDAPPVRFGTEHRTRLFAAGDKRHPLRLYYTASRAPNSWFAPDFDADGQETEDEVLSAGYLNIPGKDGDEIVTLHGEFFGSCLVGTNRGIWRVTGSGPASFAIENIVQNTGAASQAGQAQVGNDLWFAGRQGVTTISTVQQFGDMQASWPSSVISDMWAPGISNTPVRVDQGQLYRTSMAWSPNLSQVYLAFARQGASDVSSIYVFNPASSQWLGPWETDTTFVSSVEVASPVVQTVMHGTRSGRVGITNPTYPADFDEPYTMTIESAYLCGRSVDPRLTDKMKTWKLLRLFIQPRGSWNILVRWQTDEHAYQQRYENQNRIDAPTIGDTWRLGVDPDGIMHSNQMMQTIEIPLDVHGRYLKFDVSTADDIVGEDLVLQGFQVEFTAGDLE